MQWFEGHELTESGWYFMARVDDAAWLDGTPRSPVRIFQFQNVFYASYGDGNMQDVITMDEEVRWLGPVYCPDGADKDFINILGEK